MGNSLRCCLGCVLPCGALDLIRIVHLNGYVQEINRPVTAADILQANPNHVLSKPCTQGDGRKILILSSDSELKRGSIYFLIPVVSLPAVKKKGKGCGATALKSAKKSEKCQQQLLSQPQEYCNRYLTNVTSSRRHRCHRRSRSRVVEWRPHLESIAEY
ncbi:hypothetical protein SLE2022_286510 [Rubroshorea leprosula]